MSWPGKGKTAVAGIGFSRLLRTSGESIGTLALEACRAAVEDAGLESSQVDGLATYPESANAGAGREDGFGIVSVAYLLKHFPLAEEVRWYCQVEQGMIASAVIEASNALISGMANYVLVWRAMARPAGSTSAAAAANTASVARGPSQFTLTYGVGTPFQMHALAYQRYMYLYGATRKEMATLAVNQRRNANLNEQAYFRDVPLTFEDYMSARMVSDPLCLFDCDVPVQGAAALVLTTAERARDLKHPPAYIASAAQNTNGRLSRIVYTVDDHMEQGASIAGKLWAGAALGPRDMGAAMLYDGFSPSTWYWLEAASFCGRGEAHGFIQDGRIALEGELPVNTFGGSLSEGRLHGMGHLAEAVRQVTNRAGLRQVPGCKAACAIDGSPMLPGSGVVFTADP